MPACTQRKTRTNANRAWVTVFSLFVCVGPLVLGCGQAEGDFSPSSALAGMRPESITRRGKLYFVEDAGTGWRLAEEKNLPCLLFFTAQWCTYCHQMEETAFTEPAVADMAENFICVLVDADRNRDICTRFSVSGYPTIQFISPNGRALNRLVGRQSSQDLIAGMRAALKRYAWLNDAATKVR